MALPALPRRDTPPTLPSAAFAMALVVAALWLLEIVDALLGQALDTFGVSPRQVEELPQILTAPLLHDGFAHLAGNSVPLFVLGTAVLMSGLWHWLKVTLTVEVTSGLAVWLLALPGTVTLGASGVIFGWLTYLVARGYWTRRPWQIGLGAVVFLVYGGLLWGVLPTDPRVSWLGHLSGAAGGVLAAWLLHSTSERRARLAAQVSEARGRLTR